MTQDASYRCSSSCEDPGHGFRSRRNLRRLFQPRDAPNGDYRALPGLDSSPAPLALVRAVRVPPVTPIAPFHATLSRRLLLPGSTGLSGDEDGPCAGSRDFSARIGSGSSTEMFHARSRAFPTKIKHEMARGGLLYPDAWGSDASRYSSLRVFSRGTSWLFGLLPSRARARDDAPILIHSREKLRSRSRHLLGLLPCSQLVSSRKSNAFGSKVLRGVNPITSHGG